ncbi:MAG: sensor histidine kinase [Bilifractor sp.]|jgi:signal transduction histidine kinase
MKLMFRKTGHWIWIFIMTDVIFLFVTWIINPDSLKYMIPFLLLFSAIAVLMGTALDRKNMKKDEAAISAFLDQPDEKVEAELCAYFGGDEIVRTAAAEYMRMRHLVMETGSRVKDYQEYVEAWVHEVKTPISMMELMLENHKDEISPYVYERLQYAVRKLTEDAERILYYSRLHAEHPDFCIESFSLSECVKERVGEYEPFIRENRIRMKVELESAGVVSDRRIVSFMFSQLLSNAVKYTDSERGKILISVKQKTDTVCLSICNNGKNVPLEDRPFLFDKGFTGNHPGRQKATGMGLYLVKKYAAKLGVDVLLEDQIPYATGFGIRLVFHL